MMPLLFTQRWLALFAACWLLSGCLGGSIAQQIASSIITNAADKLAEKASNAYDAHQLKAEQESRNIKLEDTPPDPYWGAFVTSGFEAPQALPDAFSGSARLDANTQPRAKYQWSQVEKLPTNYAEEAEAQTEKSKLVRVEVWNLLIGTEKISALERAQKLGSTQLPSTDEWARWQVATGSLQSDHKKMITFLIPPDYGKLISGEQAFVEISDIGGLHIARYPAN